MARWCEFRAGDAVDGGIGDTASAPVAVTPANATNLIAEAAHGFGDGAGPMLLPSGTIPAGLEPDVPYFLHVEGDAGNYGVLPTRKNTLQGIAGSRMEFTTDGAAVTRSEGNNARSFFEYVKAGRKPATVQAATDVSDILYT
jgi:hypothetical protein